MARRKRRDTPSGGGGRRDSGGSKRPEAGSAHGGKEGQNGQEGSNGRGRRPSRGTGKDRGAAKRRPRSGDGYWIYGRHAALAAAGNPARTFSRALVTDAETAKLLPPNPIPEVVTRAMLDDLLPDGAVHQGIAVLARPLPPVALEDTIERSAGEARAAVVVLDQVTDPHNVGAVMRSAAAFGAAAVICPDRHAPPETAVLAKAASGALETVPLVRVTNLARALNTLKEAGFWCAGLDADGEASMGEAALPDRAALVMGAEGSGLRRLTREHCDMLVRIPMAETAGPVASLNISNAAAVALYAWTSSAAASGSGGR